MSMVKEYPLLNQIKYLESRGKLYREYAEYRLGKIEHAVFKRGIPLDPKKRLDPNTLMARLDRLEAAMTWWKQA